ncbi:MAG TPA: TonB-dependent receptor [Dokdonella sp.]|uniref:TonB-dependent receptor plug domain-containing protein n=1 Tax=Dokdonella sp. TaxID=2291710 RepID=UPI002D8085F7|nr:TonB-dependent receptor [Dokdonella sp.]HET9031680.1 TonB-dependent receptor [Dokdonella sp.]
MRLTNNELLKAVRLALYAGTTAVVGLSSVTAFAQNDADTTSERLDTIVVTGSNIRRVDIETSNPIITIDRAQITKSGKLTVGDLIQELPSIAGAATNPQVNNGGGTGASSVSLRGLGSGRTLILVDGQRIINNDINAIPANVVERIEVLLNGASSTYGSDAIAGVVNFIMRRDYQGAEFSADYGISDRDDGQRQGGSFTFGQSTDRGSVVAGVNYNKTDAVSAAKRDFSVNALYLYGGNVYEGGSSRTPTGRIFIPNTPNADGINLQDYYGGCGSITRITGASGTSLDDYRCFGGSDAYNYQPLNVILVPQERTNIFALGNYKLTDNVEAYFKTFINRTSSSSLIAPYPFDNFGNNVSVSADSLYNPFGVDFAPPGTPGGGNRLLVRLTGVGQRVSQFDTQTSQLMGGFRGNFGDTSWRWDLNANYGHLTQDQYTTGYLNFPQLADSLGPSMLVGGVPTCVGTPGDASTAIAGCVPLNIFVQDDPTSVQLLTAAGSNPFQNFLATSREVTANANGEVFDLPAGVVSLAVGMLYRKDYSNFLADSTIILNPATGTCDLGTACTSELSGNLTTKEIYAEAFVPILKDMPFANSLNLTLGTRYSKFNLAGNTTNSKIAIEWRPIEDLLLRGTVSEVFRAPGISELFAGAGSDAPTLNDPCQGYMTGQAQGIAACGPSTGATNIPATGIPPEPNSQVNGIVSGAVAAGFSLKPESGKSFDFGAVYNPGFIDGFSVSVDYYRIYLKDVISGISAQTVVDLCYNNPNSQFCPFISRLENGNVNNILEPTVNLGRLDTSGFDLGINYRIPEFDAFGRSIGRFAVGLNATYIQEYDNQVLDQRTSVAGTFSNQFGNFPRIRGVGSLDWNMGPFQAGWRVRWVGNTRVTNGDGGNGNDLPIGGVAYHNFQFGYTAEAINTQFQIGIDNAFDKQPPLYYQNNVTNANTDVRTYDTIGRYYWANATVKF